jgi:hypothetical protein
VACGFDEAPLCEAKKGVCPHLVRARLESVLLFERATRLQKIAKLAFLRFPPASARNQQALILFSDRF